MSQNIKEAIEKGLEVLSWCQENADEKWMVDHLALVRTHLDQAFALLRTEPEQPSADGMTDKFNKLTEELKSMFTVSQAMARNSFDSTTQPIKDKTDNPNPPPDHKYPEQPPASEFTKELREKHKFAIDNKLCVSTSEFVNVLTRLDQQSAQLKAKDELLFAYESVNAPVNPLLSINKDLLEACEYAHTLILRNIGQSTHAVALLEAAIAKAKEK